MADSLDFESKQKLANSDENKVTGEQEVNTKKKQCPLCKDEGRHSVINLCQINRDTAIQMCSYQQCTYPVGTEDPLQVKRSAYESELSEEQHKILLLPYSEDAPLTVSDATKHLRKKFEHTKEFIELHTQGHVCTYPVGTEDPLQVERSAYKSELSEEHHKLLKRPYSEDAPLTVSDATKHLRKKFEHTKEFTELHTQGHVCTYPVGTEDPLQVERSAYKSELSEEHHKLLKRPYSEDAPPTGSDTIKLVRKKFKRTTEHIEFHIQRYVVTEEIEMTED